MEYTTLGRTGLRVSVPASAAAVISFGDSHGKTEQESIAVVAQRLTSASTVDTAEVYGTEPNVGKALQSVAARPGCRATKKLPPLVRPCYPPAS